MAAKKPSTPKKFKQARSTAKRDAQAAITGKVKATRKDTTIKTSAEDKAAIAEQNKQGRADMKSGATREYEDSMRREEEARKARFQEDIKRIESGKDIETKKPKPATGVVKKPVPPKIQGTSQAKANAIRKGPSLVENGKVVSKARAAEIMAGAKKPATKKPATTAKKPAAATTKPMASVKKPTTTKAVVVNPGLNTPEETAKYKQAVAQGKSKKDALAIAKGGSSKALAIPSKGTKAVVDVRTANAKAAAKNASKLGVKGAALAAGTMAGRGAGKLIGGKTGLAIGAATLLAGPVIAGLKKLSPGGAGPGLKEFGESKAAKAGNANDRLYPKGTKPLGGSSKQDQAMANRGKSPMVTPTSGGSSTKVYRVEHGDTLEAIAKKSGVTLSELRKANPKAFSQKYIFRNTPVNIPQGKAIPSGSYKGPVPYVPGSKAAKKYEASRKK